MYLQHHKQIDPETVRPFIPVLSFASYYANILIWQIKENSGISAKNSR